MTFSPLPWRCMKIITEANCHTEIGPRSTNQDAVFVNSEKGYALIADGMGGAAGGKEASSLAIDTTKKFLNQYLPKLKTGFEVDELLTQAINASNKAIFTKAAETPSLYGMGTTLVALVIFDDEYHVAHVGDSRACLIRNKEIISLTKDHSIVQERIDAGLIKPEDAENQIDRNVITRAIGVESFVKPDISSGPIKNGDVFALTTDGVHSVVSPKEILAATLENSLWASSETLTQRAIKNSTTDNSSAAVINIKKNIKTSGEKLSQPQRNSKKPLLLILICFLALTGGLILAAAFFDGNPARMFK